MKKIIISIMFFAIINCSDAYCEDSDLKDESNERSTFILPAFMYSTDTGIGGGLAGIFTYYNPGSKASSVEAAAIYTQKKQFTFSGRWQHLFHNNKSRLINQFEYSKYPSYFYGIGNNSSNDDPEKYTPEYLRMKLEYEWTIKKQFKIKTNFQIINQALVKSEPGGLMKTSTVPWSSGRFDAGPGVAILWDSRDNYLATKSGTLAQFEYKGLMFQDEGGAYNTVSLDIRHFRNPFPEFVLASMLWMSDSRGDIPFYLLSSLGGNDRLRGYESERFIGRKLILFQQDVRFPVWGPFGGCIFAATGRVADKYDKLFSGQYHTGYGAGFRYFIDKKENLVVRCDIAFGSDTQSSYISFSEAF